MSVYHFVPYPLYMQFSGRVYDGPLEGAMHTEKGRDYFYVNVTSPYPSVSVLAFDPDKVPEITCRYYRGFYRWSEPLHAWVFDWRSVAS